MNQKRMLHKTVSFFIISIVSLASINTFANIDIFTALDDSSIAKKFFDGNIQVGYTVQTGNSDNSTLTANSCMTWFQQNNAYSLLAEAVNNSSYGLRSSEKYWAGVRLRHNFWNDNFIFLQANWLSDRYNGYLSRSTVTSGYGRQVLNGPIHILRLEAGPGVRHDKYYYENNATKPLAYTAVSYFYQLTDSTNFIQGISLSANDDITFNSESSLNITINYQFSFKISYNISWNYIQPAIAPKHTQTKMAILLIYNL